MKFSKDLNKYNYKKTEEEVKERNQFILFVYLI